MATEDQKNPSLTRKVFAHFGHFAMTQAFLCQADSTGALKVVRRP
jgi:hypothetical protein